MYIRTYICVTDMYSYVTVFLLLPLLLLRKAHGAEAFRAEVVDKAVPWSDWHGDRILAEHDFASDANAFRRCTDRLTGFISDLSIPTDQTFHVHRFARALAGGEFFIFYF